MSALLNLVVSLSILTLPWTVRAYLRTRRRVAAGRLFKRLQWVPIDAARGLAEKLLTESPHFGTSPISASWLKRVSRQVPVGVHEVWHRYGAPHHKGKVTARIAPHVLEQADESSVSLLRRHGAPEGLFRIGYRGALVRVFASPVEETIYEVSKGDSKLADGEFDVLIYPSIYHWLTSLEPEGTSTLLRPATVNEVDSLVRPAPDGAGTPPDELLRPEYDS